MKVIDVLYLHVCTQNIFIHMPSYMHEEFASPDVCLYHVDFCCITELLFVFQLLFIGYTASSSKGDIALDDIEIEDCGCPQTTPPRK